MEMNRERCAWNRHAPPRYSAPGRSANRAKVHAFGPSATEESVVIEDDRTSIARVLSESSVSQYHGLDPRTVGARASV